MASITSTATFTPHQSSPLARTGSPFKDPRTPPSTPGRTAKLWDEYERRAVEKARRREGSLDASKPQRTSSSDLPRTSATIIASARSSFDFKFRSRATASSAAPMAICKTCKRPITYTSGICELCKKTIVLSTSSGASTPPISPTDRRFVTADLQELHQKLSRGHAAVPKATSPTRKSFCPMPAQLLDPPIRLSSLRPPPGQELHLETGRSRKTSLTDPNEPFLRLQIAPAACFPRSASIPTSPTYPPRTPPSMSQSRTSTRPSSLANTVSPLSPTVYVPTNPYARHNSATPSDGSTLYPHTSRTASVNTTGYSVHHAKSAWDDWDSDGEGETAGFLWKGMSKPGKEKPKKKERSDGKTSLESMSAKLSCAREEERKKSREQRRSEEHSEVGKKSKAKRPRGFVRVFSCGGCGKD